MSIKGTIQIPQLAAKPSAPPVGSVIFYIKDDNIIYVQDSTGTEYPFASASVITDLHGDVIAHGPGDVPAAVVFVGGKSAAEIAQSVNDTQAATSANTPSIIVKRDASGNIFITQVNGVVPEAHASRHRPTGADPIPTAAPTSDLTADTANATGTSNSLSRSDHSHSIDTGTPVTQTPDQSNAAGTSANLTRADHIHNIPTDVPVTQNADQTNTQGSATKFSKADHVHNIPTDTPVQIGTTNFQGASTKFARADHVHQLTDGVATARLLTGFAVGSNTPVVAADSILSGFGKTQAQLNAISGSAVTSLTGDVTGTGPGATATTIAVGAVTDTKASLAVKPAVTVVAVTNQALTGTPTIDGQATVSGSLILLTAQTTGSQNGPWVAAAGAWSRPTWYPSGGTTQAFQFITTFVRLGTTYGGSVWRQTTAAPITIDTTATTWVVTPTSGNYKSAFNLGPASGSADVQLNFSNSFVGTLAWNPTASYQIKLPPTQGAAGTFPSNDGAGNLTWTNPMVNIDGGSAGSNYTPSQLINGGTA